MDWTEWIKKKMLHKDKAIVDSSALYLEQLI